MAVSYAWEGNRHADTYDWGGLTVQALVRKEIPSWGLILDVGPGWGKYHLLLPEYTMDACEIWEPYVEQERLREMYREVFVGDICELAEDTRCPLYDAVILGDVLEHIERARAKRLLKALMARHGLVLAVIPYEYEQGPEHGNPHQCHLQADLTPEIMAAEYPGLALVDAEIRAGRPFKGLYRSEQA